MLQEYGNVANIYAHLSDLKPGEARKLQEGRQAADLSKRLVTLLTDAPVQVGSWRLQLGSTALLCGLRSKPAVVC